MKSIRVLVLLSAVIITFGCVSSSEPAAEMSSNKTVGIASSDPEEVSRDLEEVPYLQKETSYFSDGYIESYKTFAFNEDMTPLREDTFNSFGENIESVVYEKVSKEEVNRNIYDEKGTLYASKSCKFDPSGNRISEKTYSAAGDLQSVSVYSYNSNGQKTGWKVLDGDDYLLSETKYIYESGLNTRIEIFDITGSLVEFFVRDFIDNQLTMSSHYIDSELKSTVEYNYDNSLLTTEIYRRATGDIIRSVNYFYDSRDNCIKIEYFDSKDILKGWTEKEYIYFLINNKA